MVVGTELRTKNTKPGALSNLHHLWKAMTLVWYTVNSGAPTTQGLAWFLMPDRSHLTSSL